MTGARFLGHVFNPVSFWFCYQDEELVCLVAEVNNTFGERHTYVLDEKLPGPDHFCARFRVPKAFYVSPFNAIEGDYEFRVAHPEDCWTFVCASLGGPARFQHLVAGPGREAGRTRSLAHFDGLPADRLVDGAPHPLGGGRALFSKEAARGL